MIALNEETKAACAKYVGADGFLVIDESVPEELKEIFHYFNNEGIKILEMNIDDSLGNSDLKESFLEENNDFNSEISENDFLENNNIDLDDLNSIF